MHLLKVKATDGANIDNSPALLKKNLKSTDVQIRKIKIKKNSAQITVSDQDLSGQIQKLLEEMDTLSCNPIVLRNSNLGYMISRMTSRMTRSFTRFVIRTVLRSKMRDLMILTSSLASRLSSHIKRILIKDSTQKQL